MTVCAVAMANGRAVRLKSARGYGDKIVTPSAREAGKWQLTDFTKDGEPWGHHDFESLELALRTAMGQWRDEIPGPPFGDSSYAVAAIQSPARTL